MVEMKKYRDNMGQIGTIPYLNRKIHRLGSPLRQSLWIATPFNLGNLNSTLRDVKVMSCDGYIETLVSISDTKKVSFSITSDSDLSALFGGCCLFSS